MDEQKVEFLFAQSEDISTSAIGNMAFMNNISLAIQPGGDQTLGGYLIRSFFCGGIALHRYYMGTDRNAMWAMYLCIPVVGGVAVVVDFFWVVFEGTDAMNKYKDNDKYLVWAGN